MDSPCFIDWAITARCNLSCRHCRGISGGELSTERAKSLINEIAELKPAWVIVEGGEPLLREGITELLKLMREKRLGWLTAAEGLGALIGSLLTSSMGRFSNKGTLLVSFMVAWSVSLGVFASLHVVYLNLILLGISGIVRGLAMAFMQVLLLETASVKMRGRVSGVRALAIIMLPVGNVIAGVGASTFGAVPTLLVGAAGGIITPLLTLLWVPKLAHRE